MQDIRDKYVGLQTFVYIINETEADEMCQIHKKMSKKDEKLGQTDNVPETKSDYNLIIRIRKADESQGADIRGNRQIGRKKGGIFMDRAITDMNQVGLVVRDVRKAAELFSKGFGQDLLNVRFGNVQGDKDFNNNSISIDNVYLDGEYIGSYGIEMAAVNFENGVQLEIIEPAGNRSIFREYLEEHGPGVQHVAVTGDFGFHETLGRMAAAGNPLGQFARVDGEQEECAFVKHRYTLGLDMELHNRLKDFRLPDVKPNFIKADRAVFPRPLVTAIAGVNVAAARLEPVLSMLREKYGLAEWEYEEAHGLRHAYYRGLKTEIQLLEPLDDTSNAAKWLKAHGGNGVCSVEFACDGTEEDIARALENMGRTPQKMFANKTGADFEDIFGMGLVFRAMK